MLGFIFGWAAGWAFLIACTLGIAAYAVHTGRVLLQQCVVDELPKTGGDP